MNCRENRFWSDPKQISSEILTGTLNQPIVFTLVHQNNKSAIEKNLKD